jgi:dienelactone hydrolase
MQKITNTIPWDSKSLAAAPKVVEDPQHSANDVKACFYVGLPWKGKPTRVFAYYGLPKLKGKEKIPAMVLVHGGGGSAFSRWVQLWVSRGYAAIAMDTCGCISGGGHNNHKRHAYGGPPGWGGFDQLDLPVEDQWPYHAVADAILAHSLIRSFPEVDPERIGLTGVSWGGVLACITAGVDQRFKFVAPVYGCGFLGDDSVTCFMTDFQKLGPDKTAKWLGLWDPAVYLPYVRMPILWVSGSNDSFPMDSLRKSYRLPMAPRTLCVRVGMAHGHGPGETPEEIYALAESLFRNGAPLVRITRSGRKGLNAWAFFKAKTPIRKAELNYTTDSGPWQDRKWKTIPAVFDVKAGRMSAVLPKNTKVYYFNLVDNRNLVVSSEHEEIMPDKKLEVK